MKNPFQRIAALALCFSLTLGAFAYRPSEAKAIAGVDDAVVIGALLSAFAGGCGLIFSNNGMTSGELAQGLTDKWNEFKAAVLKTDTTFAGWLGYEDMDALLQAIVLSGGNALTVPRLVAHKFSDFTTWLVDNLGVSAGGVSRLILTGNSDYAPALASAAIDSEVAFLRAQGAADESIDRYISSFDGVKYIGVHFPTPVSIECNRQGSVQASYIVAYSSDNPQFIVYDGTVYVSGLGRPVAVFLSGSKSLFCFAEDGSYLGARSWGGGPSSVQLSDYIDGVTFSGDSPVTDLSVFAPSYYKNPTIDLPAEGEEAANPTLSGVGDGTATTIEGLLQQILAQLQANTLAPTLDLAGTETGGNTGTDEDAKPYLPYIPQIFEKIKELPGTLANIWESIKGIPAAIAEKIGAFFTTLWGWLQSIIDAITALPAAIAEKIGALFKPDEALLTEITDTFKGKFGFFSTLKQFGNDLFGMTPETEPPVIWVHLENAESKFGYNYGDKQKIFDMTWYQKYKASVDGLLSGFLWLGYLWLLFKRAPAILGGMQLSVDDAPRSADMPDVLSSPRLGAGDGSTMYRGDGFTMRDKGGRSK